MKNQNKDKKVQAEIDAIAEQWVNLVLAQIKTKSKPKSIKITN